MSEYTIAVAKTILAQIGGHQAVAMMDISQVTAIETGVRIKFNAIAKMMKSIMRPNVIEIHLDHSDTYTLKFFRVEEQFRQNSELKTITGIYNNQLKQVIEEETCLYLSL